MTAYHEATSELLINEHTEERFLSEYVQNISRTLDVVQQGKVLDIVCATEMNFNRKVSI